MSRNHRGVNRANGRVIEAVCETLEERRMLAPFVCNGTNGNDTISVQIIPGFPFDSIRCTVNGNVSSGLDTLFDGIVINGGGGADTITLIENGDNPTTVSGGTGNDTINVGDDNVDLNIDSNVTVDGDDGADQLEFDDRESTGNDAYLVNSSVVSKTGFGGLSYSSISALVINCNADDNAITVTSTPTGTSLFVNGNQGNDTAVLGGGDLDSNLLGDNVSYNGGIGTDTITFDDDSDSIGADNYALTSAALDKPNIGSLGYSSTERINLLASQNNDTISINSTLFGVAVSIAGNGGNDTINHGNGDIDTNTDSDITISGGLGDDTLNLLDGGDLGNDLYTLTSTSLTKTDLVNTFTYSGMEGLSLTANNADNDINVNSTADGCALTLNGGGGNDVITIGNGSVSSVLGNSPDVVVDGGADTDAITYFGGASASIP
jgi:hypothetical protein